MNHWRRARVCFIQLQMQERRKERRTQRRPEQQQQKPLKQQQQQNARKRGEYYTRRDKNAIAPLGMGVNPKRRKAEVFSKLHSRASRQAKRLDAGLWPRLGLRGFRNRGACPATERHPRCQKPTGARMSANSSRADTQLQDGGARIGIEPRRSQRTAAEGIVTLAERHDVHGGADLHLLHVRYRYQIR